MRPLAHSSLMAPAPRTPRPPALHRPGTPSGPGGVEAAPRVRPEELTQHMPRLRNVIRRILNHHEYDTEDVLQEVLLTALKHLKNFRGDASLGTWLHRIAVNAALAYRRQKAHQARHEERPIDQANLASSTPQAQSWQPRSQRPDQETMNHELKSLIDAAIAKLPPMYREVYLLADLDQQPNETIAHRLQLKLAAVKSRLHRARKMMREQLAPYCGDWFDKMSTSRAAPLTENQASDAPPSENSPASLSDPASPACQAPVEETDSIPTPECHA